MATLARPCVLPVHAFLMAWVPARDRSNVEGPGVAPPMSPFPCGGWSRARSSERKLRQPGRLHARHLLMTRQDLRPLADCGLP